MTLTIRSAALGAVVLLLAALAALVLLPGALAWSERSVRRYASHADAVKAGAAVEGGWIPAYVPPDATAIVEVHSIDTNEQLLRFEASSESLARMAASLPRATGERLAPRRALLRGDRSWREELAASPPPRGVSLHLVRREHGDHCVAIDASRGAVQAWTCSE